MNSKFFSVRLKIGNFFSLYIPGRILALILLVALLATPALISPERIPLPQCYFKRYTGYSCPTCGLTHSFHEVAHLRFREAFRHHLLGPVLYFALACLFLITMYEVIGGRTVTLSIKPGTRRTLIFVLLGVWMILWLIRFIGELKR